AARHLLESGGKRIRPYILLKSCEIVGGDPNNAISFAAAVELLHNFSLIHDDIMDNDPLRRGVPTVHVKWGIPIAITSGDLLFAKTYESILKGKKISPLTHDRFIECIERITTATISICEGQAMDLSFQSSDVGEDDYLKMIDGKTASLFKACAEIGGIVGGGESTEVRILGEFAWNSGVAFQLIDDYLGLIGDEKTLGKPVGSDIREGKKTLIIIHA
ncbi:polyprenyl synthetase family protein, partial [Candidatus Bathyarchaeota archaeon]|nr:polyprenyl synthetase family protein [Candidatus Bathyarchaeota archaeon]